MLAVAEMGGEAGALPKKAQNGGNVGESNASDNNGDVEGI
jgi:hypothetical protein